ncbi:MAG: dolichyl-phosphate beta-glucosyltransferase [Thermodesulfobacteriota bacterium]
MPVEISIVIPAFNEESVIGETITEVSEYLENRGLDYELIVVSDGSTDRTLEIAQRFCEGNNRVKVLKNDRRMGKGFAVKKGVLAATGAVIAFTDADLSYPIEEVEKPLKLISEKETDAAIGSRTVRGADIEVATSPLRKLMSLVFNFFVRIIAIPGIGDTQCGFKAFSHDAARDIFTRQTLAGFSFDVEIIYIAKKLGYRVMEFPIHLARDSRASSINPVSDSLGMFIDILRIRLLGIRGRYKKDKNIDR